MSARPRIGAYIRVSSADQVDNWSLDAQHEAIARYCAAQGWDAPILYRDAGHSAHEDAAAKRPAWRALLADAEAGRLDVVICHKLDRWARNVPAALSAIALLERCGVGFVSLSENMSFTGPWGKAILAILSVFAQLSSDNLSHETKKGLAARRAAGFRHATLPFGARLVGGVGPAIELDPARAATLALLLDRVAAASYAGAMNALHAAGLPPLRAARWNTSSVRSVVNAAGWLLDQPDPWPSRYTAAAQRIGHAAVRAGKRVRLLTGLVRCGRCGSSVGYQPRDPHPPGLRCQRHCGGGPPFLAAVTEARVLAWVAAIPDLVPLLHRAARLAGANDAVIADLAALRAAGERLGLAYTDGLVSLATYQARKDDLVAQERAIAPALPTSAAWLGELVALRDVLPQLPPAAGNVALRQVVRRIVLDGDVVQITPHDGLAPLFGSV